jgi:hypothetical protein
MYSLDQLYQQRMLGNVFAGKAKETSIEAKEAY